MFSVNKSYSNLYMNHTKNNLWPLANNDVLAILVGLVIFVLACLKK